MALARRENTATIEGYSNSQLVAVTGLCRRTYFFAKRRQLELGLFTVERTTAPGRGLSKNRYHLHASVPFSPRAGVNFMHSRVDRSCPFGRDAEVLRSTTSAVPVKTRRSTSGARPPRDALPAPGDPRRRNLFTELTSLFPGAPPPARQQWITFSRVLPRELFGAAIAKAEQLAARAKYYRSVTAVFSWWLLDQLRGFPDALAQLPARLHQRLAKGGYRWHEAKPGEFDRRSRVLEARSASPAPAGPDPRAQQLAESIDHYSQRILDATPDPELRRRLALIYSRTLTSEVP